MVAVATNGDTTTAADFKITSPVAMEIPEASGETAILLHAPLLAFLFLLVVIGVTGNGLSFFIYHFRWPPSTFTLCVRFLAVLDFVNLSLAMSLVAWQVLGQENSLLLCRLTHGLAYTCNSSTGMIVALIAIQRYRKVVTPWKRAIPLRVAVLLCVVAILMSSSASYSYVMTFDRRNFTVTLDPNRTVALQVCHTGSMESAQPWTSVSSTAIGVGLAVINVTLFVTYTAISISVVRRRRARARALMMMSPLFSRPTALRGMVSSSMFLEKGPATVPLGASIRKHSTVRRISGVVLRRNATLKTLKYSYLSKSEVFEECEKDDTRDDSPQSRNRPESMPLTKSLSTAAGISSSAARPGTVSVPILKPFAARRKGKESLRKRRSASSITLQSGQETHSRHPRQREGNFYTFPWKRHTVNRLSELPYSTTSSSSSCPGGMRRLSSLQTLRMLYRRSGSSSASRRASRNRSEIFPDTRNLSTPRLLRYEPFRQETTTTVSANQTTESDHVTSCQGEFVAKGKESPNVKGAEMTSSENVTSGHLDTIVGESIRDDASSDDSDERLGADSYSFGTRDKINEGNECESRPLSLSDLTLASRNEECSSVNTSMSEIHDFDSDILSSSAASLKCRGSETLQNERYSSFESSKPQWRPPFRRVSVPPKIDRKNYSTNFETSPLLATVVESSNEPRSPSAKVPNSPSSFASNGYGATSSTNSRESSDAVATSKSRNQWGDPLQEKAGNISEEPAVKRRKKSTDARPDPMLQTPVKIVDLTSQCTRMCLALTLVYPISYVPYCIVLALGFQSTFGQELSPLTFALFEISFFFLNINNTVNPIIYGVMSKKFRDECLKCWKTVKKNFGCAESP